MFKENEHSVPESIIRIRKFKTFLPLPVLLVEEIFCGLSLATSATHVTFRTKFPISAISYSMLKLLSTLKSAMQIMFKYFLFKRGIFKYFITLFLSFFYDLIFNYHYTDKYLHTLLSVLFTREKWINKN